MSFDFHSVETSVLQWWDERKIFAKSLAARVRGRKRFVFFEGPPTANGNPGIHHFIGRAFKDLFNRYKTMRGYFVLRKSGWDTHGLPVELQVEKELGFKNKKDIEAYGIAAFNKKCRESVWKYRNEWEVLTKRMGFWVDLEHPYITYDNRYIESVWAVLSKIWEKKLLYQAHKIVPFCTRCGTPLSSHEVAQGYKEVTDRSVYIKFKIKPGQKIGETMVDDDTYILAWTTTPWTLPGNVALAVGSDINYVISRQERNGKEESWILAKDVYEKEGSLFAIEAEFGGAKAYLPLCIKGKELIGLEYEPLFDIPTLQSDTAYKIYPASFVTTTDGTGVVHTAVMYGEDDYVLGTELGLPKVHTVTEQGVFDGVSPELDGRYVKTKATEDIILEQLEQRGQLLKIEPYTHEYPFCWRCDTPLLYYAKDSWFIRMSSLRDQLLANNANINWVPEHLKEGRFGQWLKEVRDWAISRERYWATPLPIWQCVQCRHQRLIGSLEQLATGAVGSGNTYYLLRHGATTRDENGAGTINFTLEKDDYHLTEDGQAQVTAIVEKLKALEQVDVIYTSPFMRTQETAGIAARAFHQEIITDDRLRELAHPAPCEGQSHAACGRSEERVFVHPDGGGETLPDLQLRLAAFMAEVEATHRNKKILIVSHGAPLWLLEKMMRGLGTQQINTIKGSDEDWYPSVAGLKKTTWVTMPRDEHGELDLHRPFVDNVLISCEKCGANMQRVPDLIDVWFDSGAMPYAQWHWPFENDKTYKEQFPADFITEAIDQTRGWFYTLLAISTLLGKGAPYKNVMCYSHVLDEKGQKMSKSKGNIVSPFEVMDTIGVDAARWYFYTVNSPGDSKSFSMKEARDRLTGFLGTLQNCVRFYELYEQQHTDAETTAAPKITHLLDKWIWSRLHRTIALVTERMDAYDLTPAARALEGFVVDDLSNWWLRRSRKRTEALPLLRTVLLETSKLLAPFVPFTAEDMHRRLHGDQHDGPESVHLADWPDLKKRAINDALEAEMARVQTTVTAGLATRKDKQIKVRQPLAKVTIIGAKLSRDLEELVRDELNVKTVGYATTGELSLDVELTPELITEGYARECIRQIQDLRKEAGYGFGDQVRVHWSSTDDAVIEAIRHYADMIREETLLSELTHTANDGAAYDTTTDAELAPGKPVWLGIRR